MSSVLPYIAPSRPKSKIRLVSAMRHMYRLLRNVEDTPQAFYVMEALNGGALQKSLYRSVSSMEGRQRLRDKVVLPEYLDNHAQFESLPLNSLARLYVDFMVREDLSAAGLIAENEVVKNSLEYDDDLQWYENRFRDTHDLFHVITGYGRDHLGEAALFGFSNAQLGGAGFLFLSFMGCRAIARNAPKDAKIWDVYKEARISGKKAHNLMDQDLVSLMRLPLSEVRSLLAVPKPEAYLQALEHSKTILHTPMDPQTGW